MLENQNIILSHRGDLDGEMIDMLLQMADKRLSDMRTQKLVKKKVINIMVESLQNSFHYSNEFPEDEVINHSSFIVLTKNEKHFTIFAGNYVTEERADKLRQKINRLDDLNMLELQNFYLNTLNKADIPVSGGAGLGLIDIMRRSDGNCSYDFETLDNGYLLFSMKVDIEV
ncbi:MAG: hypothetical protein EAZ55_11580 [Cytophagales bacterium]|nr:MAG: hypothetical protein EAZ55_11580 [Cytophagales bacterium]